MLRACCNNFLAQLLSNTSFIKLLLLKLYLVKEKLNKDTNTGKVNQVKRRRWKKLEMNLLSSLNRTSKMWYTLAETSELQDRIKNVIHPSGNQWIAGQTPNVFSCVNIKLGSDEENVTSFSHFHHEFTGMNLFLAWYQDVSSLAFWIQSINKVDIRVWNYLL